MCTVVLPKAKITNPNPDLLTHGAIVQTPESNQGKTFGPSHHRDAAGNEQVKNAFSEVRV